MVSHAVPHTVGSAPHAPSTARVEALPPAGLELAPSAPGSSRRQLVRRADRSAPSALHDQPASAAPCAWPGPRCRFGSPAAARPPPRPDPQRRRARRRRRRGCSPTKSNRGPFSFSTSSLRRRNRLCVRGFAYRLHAPDPPSEPLVELLAGLEVPPLELLAGFKRKAGLLHERAESGNVGHVDRMRHQAPYQQIPGRLISQMRPSFSICVAFV